MKRRRAVAGATTLALAATTLFAAGALATPQAEDLASPQDAVTSTQTFDLDVEGEDAEEPWVEEAPEVEGDENFEEAEDVGLNEAEEIETLAEEDEAAVAAADPEPSDICEIPQGKFTGSLGSSDTVRLSGANRYSTAVAIAKKVNSTGSNGEKALFLASGADFADGLALGALAASKSWPIVLTAKGSLSAPTATHISEQKPTHIYIGGGNGAVSKAVEDQVQALAPDAQIHRFNGSDRYDTAARIAECFPEGTDAFVVTGKGFADAVVAAGPAAKHKGAIVLTPGASASPSAKAAVKRLQSKNIYMIGGKWADSQQEALRTAAASGAKSAVLSGKNRYGTSVKVAQKFYGAKPSKALFAVGTAFPDALAGASASALADAPVLLTRAKCRPKDIETISKSVKNKILLGGTGVVSKDSHSKTCVPPPKETKGDKVAKVARAQAGKAYAYGGTGPHAFDCSGLTQYAHSQVGIAIPRTSYSQLLAGKRVASPRPGDVVVMGRGGHVGIYLSPGLVVDAGNYRVGVIVRATPMPVDAYVRFT